MKRTFKALDSIEKIPPHSIELEQNLLGAMMIDSDAIDLLIPLIYPNQMYVNAHEAIYKVIIALREKDYPVDTLTVSEELNKRGELEKIGGPAYIAELSNVFSGTGNLQYSAKILVDDWIKREIITSTYQLHNAAYRGDFTADDLISQYHKQALDLINRLTTGEIKTFDVNEAIKSIGNIPGITLKRFPLLMQLIGSFRSGELIIEAARPSVGKTAELLDYCIDLAQQGIPSGIISLEMSQKMLSLRILSKITNVSCRNIVYNNLTMQDKATLKKFSDEIDYYKNMIFIDDKSRRLSHILSSSRKMVSKYNCQFIGVDYLQIVEIDEKQERRDLDLGNMTRKFKWTSEDLEIPFMVLSQITRKIEERKEDSKPRLSDLRESGKIEEDADVVIFIHRPDIHVKTSPCTKIVAKDRNGLTGEIPMYFEEHDITFHENKDNNYAKSHHN